MTFVVYDHANEAAYLHFAGKVGGSSLCVPFNYYEASERVAVRRNLLIDNSTDPPAVIGAVTTKEQDYVLAGEAVRVAVATYPISLGIAEPKYAMAGMLVFRELLEAYPLNFLLGMGPPESNTTAKLCQLLGWRLTPIPYLFMPRRLAPLAAKQLAHRPPLACAIRLAGKLGLLAPMEAILRTRAQRPEKKIDIVNVATFDAAFDTWWLDYCKTIGFGLIRDSQQMNVMFPGRIGAFERLLFLRNGQLVGFSVLLVPKKEDVQRALGANVVTLVEFCANGADLADAAKALSQRLLCQNLDAVIVNHSHGATIEALKAAGFWMRTTSTYMAVSPALQARLDSARVSPAQMMISRADGDGPIGLGVEF